MKRSYFYLLLLCLLAVITYLDRVCISVAGPHIQDALHISPEQWGWVGTVFLLGYALFEIPGGHLGDKLGARRVLTRIVIWWSAFTALTGAITGYPILLVVRFLFGVGEAGAFPASSVAIANWFPPAKRGRAFGVFIMSSQLGGALAPLAVVPIQREFGWRSSFFVFGTLGVLWAMVWFWRFRDRPSEPREIEIASEKSLGLVLRNRSLWSIMAIAFTYVYSMSFFQTWFHTYLVKGRGFDDRALSWSALPYVFGAASNLIGGLTSDWLAPRIGVLWARRVVGMTGLLVSAASMSSAMFVRDHLGVILCLSLAYAGITFQQPAVFAACLDMGAGRGGAITGFMNTAGQIGGALSSVVFGYIVKIGGNYDAPLTPMAVLLCAGGVLWTTVTCVYETPPE